MIRWLVFGWLILGVGCAHLPVVVNIACPPDPILLPVEVRDGKLDQQEVNNVVKNWTSIWSYIHRLKQLGCKTH